MKRICAFIFAAIATVSMLQAATIDINGTAYPVDTTAHYQAGPGVWHTRFSVKIGSNTHHCYLLEIDMTNPHNKVEEWQAQSQMGKQETMASAHKKLDAPNHRTVGGVNCNFWVVTSQNTGNREGLLGQPFSGTARNGVLIGEPDSWNSSKGDRGFVMVDRNDKVWIDNMKFQGRITIGDSTQTINDVNRPRVTPKENEICLFNHYMGAIPTRAYDGVEVVFATQEWNINGTMTGVVESVNKTGGTVIKEGQGVLQARGTKQGFIEQLKVGDTFTMKLGVVSTNNTSWKPDVMQMVTGNCLVMVNGELTDRNTNEDYNNKNYPRTMLATNNEGNRMWMMVAEKPGMFTAQMCGILKNAGATYAAGMDGGGSAQMCLDGQVINPTTEGSARAVANSIWVISTAPDDSIVARLESAEETIRLPRYGVFAPVFRSYNQYGVLLSHAQPNVVLSCDEKTGYINEEGHFVCLAGGTLTATCDNATKTFQVELVPTTGIDIRLDSVVVMNNTHYPIEVNATASGTTLPIFGSALAWTVEDPTICSVSEAGELNGIANGVTTVIGEIDGQRDSLRVIVEIPNANPLCANRFMGDEAGIWTIKASSDAWNTALITNADGKAVIDFTYGPARQPNIELQTDSRLFGLPEQITLPIVLDKDLLTNVNFKVQAANATSPEQYKYEDIKVGEQTVATFDVAKECGTDIAIFPLRIKGIQFNLNTSALKAGDHCQIVLEGLYLHYGDLVVGFDNIFSSSLSIYPNPTHDVLYINGVEENTPMYLYDLQGRCVVHQMVNSTGMDLRNLAIGTYILQVGSETVKIIKQ